MVIYLDTDDRAEDDKTPRFPDGGVGGINDAQGWVIHYGG